MICMIGLLKSIGEIQGRNKLHPQGHNPFLCRLRSISERHSNTQLRCFTRSGDGESQ